MYVKLPFPRGESDGRLGRTALRSLVVLAAFAFGAFFAGAAAAQTQPPTCSITGFLQTCTGGTTELCGPQGAYTFAWSNGDTTRCITVGPGSYSLIVSENGVPSTNTCQVTVVGGSEASSNLEVTKTAESAVDDGDVIHYVLRVRNLSASVDLENVRVTDTLCDSVRWVHNASRTPTSQPESNALGGTVEWTISTLDAEETVEIRYDVRADLADENCTGGDYLCENDVAVHVNCDSSSAALAAATDSVTTTIRCDGDSTGGGGDGEDLGSCPRGPGFWKQQCAKDHGHGHGNGNGNGNGRGHGKFTEDEMDQILARIDERLTDWDGDIDSFCDLLDTKGPKTAEDRAWRQIATFMANWAAGDLELTGSGEGMIGFDPDALVNCGDFEAMTIDELIDELDDAVDDLNGSAASDSGITWESIAECLGDINDGHGVLLAEDCEGDDDDCDDHGRSGWLSRGDCDDEDDDARHAGARLTAASPNPFSGQTGFRYEVLDEGGADVSIAVYNVAGRQVRSLVSEHRTSGEHAVTWDGRTNTGTRAPRGIYFVRATIDGRQVPAQRLLFLGD